MSRQFNGITKRENKHYKRRFQKTQNPPMEGICEVIHGLRLMITATSHQFKAQKQSENKHYKRISSILVLVTNGR